MSVENSVFCPPKIQNKFNLYLQHLPGLLSFFFLISVGGVRQVDSNWKSTWRNPPTVSVNTTSTKIHLTKPTKISGEFFYTDYRTSGKIPRKSTYFRFLNIQRENSSNSTNFISSILGGFLVDSHFREHGNMCFFVEFYQRSCNPCRKNPRKSWWVLSSGFSWKLCPQKPQVDSTKKHIFPFFEFIEFDEFYFLDTFSLVDFWWILIFVNTENQNPPKGNQTFGLSR